MSNKVVTHPGIIKEIGENTVNVKIIVSSACASCKIKGVCNVSDVEEKNVLVKVKDSSIYETGQNVIIEMKQSLGNWAVMLGYIFPFFVLLFSMIIFTTLNFDEGLAGLFSILLLIPYYLVLYLTRNKLGSKFNYTIR